MQARNTINLGISYIFGCFNIFFCFLGASSVRRVKNPLYENKQYIVEINEQLDIIRIIDNNKITAVYFLGLPAYKASTINMLQEVVSNRSYYRLSWLDFYTDMGMTRMVV